MLTVLTGLSSALIFGAADFLGGLAAKRISAVRVTAMSAVVGLITMAAILALTGGVWSAEAVLWGAASGVVGAVAIALLYACLAIGPMSILSPLTAVVSAVVPMTFGLVRGVSFPPVGYVALGLALVAIVLVGFVPEKGAVRPSARGLIMATASGALIGVFLIIMDQTPDDSGLVPLVINRVVNGTIMFAAVGVIALFALKRRAERSGGGWRPGLPFALGAGLADGIANALILLGLRMGDLTTMSVLVAMYPAGTIILAAFVLRERIAPVQWVGLVLALIAAGLLGFATEAAPDPGSVDPVPVPAALG